MGDDAILWNKRAKGLTWAKICTDHFPSKSPNACRKRHERLRINPPFDEFKSAGFSEACRAYVESREQIWKTLCRKFDLGGDWNVIEKDIMNSGLQTIVTEGRAYAR